MEKEKYIGKYLIVQVKNNDVKIIDVFDTEKSALEFGKAHWREYDRKNGVIGCVHRRASSIYSYYDDLITSWIEI